MYVHTIITAIVHVKLNLVLCVYILLKEYRPNKKEKKKSLFIPFCNAE